MSFAALDRDRPGALPVASEPEFVAKNMRFSGNLAS